MTTTHELGHLIGGWACGGSLQTAELAPWRLPYSIFVPDPRPLVTLWCGPLLGIAIPAGIALVVRRDVCWFVAHFCALANGVYLATSWFYGDRYLDAPRLLEYGASPFWLGLYCLLSIGIGYVGFRRVLGRIWNSSRQPAK